MRLGYIYEILEAEKKNILVEHQQNGNSILVGNFTQLRKSVVKVSKIKALSEQSSIVLGQLPVTKDGESLNISGTIFNSLNKQVKKLSQMVQMLLQTLKATIEIPEEGTVYVKLPKFNSLHSLNEEISLLEGGFNQIFGCLDKDMRVELKGFDVGTPWLVFFAVGSAAVTFFAGTLIAAMKVSQEVMETKIKLNKFQSSNSNTEALEKVSEAMDLLVDQVATVEAKKLVEKYHANPSTETAEDAIRVATALKKLSGIFAEGGDVQFPLLTQRCLEESEGDSESLDVVEISKQLESSFDVLASLPSPQEEPE